MADATFVISPERDAAPAPALFAVAEESSSLKRLLRNPVAVGAVAYLVVLGLVTVFASRIAPYNPYTLDLVNPLQTPSVHHLLGTDDLGRDILSRLLYGARLSLGISAAVVATVVVLAVPVGLVAGFYGGVADGVMMRLVDAGLSIPPLVLALTVAGVLGPGVTNLIIALIVVFTPGMIRVVRGQALAVGRETFIEASKVAGTSTPRILWHRMLPNVLAVVVIQASFMLGGALLAEAGLSYLGLGAQAPQASWGNMLRRAYDTVLFNHPWELFIPGVAIAVTVLAFFAVGDGLRDALASVKESAVLGRAPLGITPVARAAADAVPVVERNGGAPLLSVENLVVSVPINRKVSAPVVDGVSFRIAPREMLGLVGESGCGKTMTSLSILRLVPAPARITGGRVLFGDQDLLSLDFDGLRRVRGKGIGMVFQDPLSSLDPAFTIGNQLIEAQRLHEEVRSEVALSRGMEMLHHVGIRDPRRVTQSFAHELSGGMRQRAMIAIALACKPKLLIADEPTTGVDVTIQAQILALLRRLRDEMSLAVLLVTHDLAVVSEFCDRVVVMYAGQVVDEGPRDAMFARPLHPYTRALLGAIPQPDRRVGRLEAIPGRVPLPGQMPAGCRFHPRCSMAAAECLEAPIPLRQLPLHRSVRCVRVEN